MPRQEDLRKVNEMLSGLMEAAQDNRQEVGSGFQEQLECLSSAITIVSTLIVIGCNATKESVSLIGRHLAQHSIRKDGVWHCPRCNSRVKSRHTHCHKCGQKIDWEE